MAHSCVTDFGTLRMFAMFPCCVASESVMEISGSQSQTPTAGQNQTVLSEPVLWDSTFRSVIQLVVQCLLESVYARRGIAQNLGRSRQTFRHRQAWRNIRPGRDVHSGSPTSFHSEGRRSGNRTTVVLENQIYEVPPREDYVSNFMRQLSQESQEIGAVRQTDISLHRLHQYHPYSTNADLTSRRRHHHLRERRMATTLTRVGGHPQHRNRWSGWRRQVLQQMDREGSELYHRSIDDIESTSRNGGPMQQEEAGRMLGIEHSAERGAEFTERQYSRDDSPRTNSGQGDLLSEADGERGTWVSSSDSDFTGRQFSSSGSLAELFDHLLQQFYREAIMWIFVTTVWHPQQENLRQMLSIIADVVHEPWVSVTTSMLQGFMTGIRLSYDSQFQSLLGILNPLSGLDSLSSSTAAFLRAQSLMFSINLAPRQLLHRFSGIVMNAMTVMIQQHSARIIDQPRW